MKLTMGWMQAKKHNRQEFVNVYLTPFGQVVKADRVDKCVQIEKEIIREMLNDLISDYPRHHSFSTFNNSIESYISLTSFKKIKRVSNIINLKKYSDSDLDGINFFKEPMQDDENRITIGMLFNFQLPEHCRLGIFCCVDEDMILKAIRENNNEANVLQLIKQNYSELLPHHIPADVGFFGLNIPEIRSLIEGLDGIDIKFKNYRRLNYDTTKSNMLNEFKAEKKKMQNLLKGEDALKTVLLYERWFWDKLRLNTKQFAPQRGDENSMDVVISDAAKLKDYFIPLFPHSLSMHSCDTILCIWDFLENCKLYIGPPSFTLSDLVSSVTYQNSDLTSTGQVIFDEINCIFTDLLFQEVRNRASVITEKEWQDILFINPINILTWPQIALQAIRILSFPASPETLKTILRSNLTFGNNGRKYDILCLLYNHPYIDLFMIAEKDISVDDSNKVEIARTVDNLQKIQSSLLD